MDFNIKLNNNASPTRMANITSIIGHRILDGGEYMYQVRFGRYGTSWVKDSEMVGEQVIAEYNKQKGIHTAYIVCRVSSKKQSGPTHVSLRGQERRIRSLGNFPEHCRVKVIRISASAYKSVPKVLLDLFENTLSGDYLMFYSVDRVSRNIELFINLLLEQHNKGVRIYTAVEEMWYGDNRSRFYQCILNAQMESEAISRRVRMALDTKRRRGDFMGQTPFGFSKGRELETERIILVPNAEEMKVRDFISARWNRSADEVATELNDAGLMYRGRQWTPKLVSMVQYQMFNFPAQQNTKKRSK